MLSSSNIWNIVDTMPIPVEEQGIQQAYIVENSRSLPDLLPGFRVYNTDRNSHVPFASYMYNVDSQRMQDFGNLKSEQLSWIVDRGDVAMADQPPIDVKSERHVPVSEDGIPVGGLPPAGAVTKPYEPPALPLAPPHVPGTAPAVVRGSRARGSRAPSPTGSVTSSVSTVSSSTASRLSRLSRVSGGDAAADDSKSGKEGEKKEKKKDLFPPDVSLSDDDDDDDADDEGKGDEVRVKVEPDDDPGTDPSGVKSERKTKTAKPMTKAARHARLMRVRKAMLKIKTEDDVLTHYNHIARLRSTGNSDDVEDADEMFQALKQIDRALNTSKIPIAREEKELEEKSEPETLKPRLRRSIKKKADKKLEVLKKTSKKLTEDVASGSISSVNMDALKKGVSDAGTAIDDYTIMSSILDDLHEADEDAEKLSTIMEDEDEEKLPAVKDETSENEPKPYQAPKRVEDPATAALVKKLTDAYDRLAAEERAKEAAKEKVKKEVIARSTNVPVEEVKTVEPTGYIDPLQSMTVAELIQRRDEYRLQLRNSGAQRNRGASFEVDGKQSYDLEYFPPEEAKYTERSLSSGAVVRTVLTPRRVSELDRHIANAESAVICPLSSERITDPLIIREGDTEYMFQRSALEEYFEYKDPVTIPVVPEFRHDFTDEEYERYCETVIENSRYQAHLRSLIDRRGNPLNPLTQLPLNGQVPSDGRAQLARLDGNLNRLIAEREARLNPSNITTDLELIGTVATLERIEEAISQRTGVKRHSDESMEENPKLKFPRLAEGDHEEQELPVPNARSPVLGGNAPQLRQARNQFFQIPEQVEIDAARAVAADGNVPVDILEPSWVADIRHLEGVEGRYRELEQVYGRQIQRLQRDLQEINTNRRRETRDQRERRRAERVLAWERGRLREGLTPDQIVELQNLVNRGGAAAIRDEIATIRFLNE